MLQRDKEGDYPQRLLSDLLAQASPSPFSAGALPPLSQLHWLAALSSSHGGTREEEEEEEEEEEGGGPSCPLKSKNWFCISGLLLRQGPLRERIFS